jgi:hypothetical protein
MNTPAVWTGRVMSGLVVLFLLLASATPKLFMADVSAPTMQQLGWPARYTLLLGCIELACVVLYAVPRTADGDAPAHRQSGVQSHAVQSVHGPPDVGRPVVARASCARPDSTAGADTAVSRSFADHIVIFTSVSSSHTREHCHVDH